MPLFGAPTLAAFGDAARRLAPLQRAARAVVSDPKSCRLSSAELMRPVLLAAAAGIAVGAALLIRRRRASTHIEEVEHIEEVAPSPVPPDIEKKLQRGSTVALPPPDPSPGKEREPKEFAAFVSHFKLEAAMEARFLQQSLEEALGRSVFLDSDDLNDLRLLKRAVVQSDVLVLIQSARVMERPSVGRARTNILAFLWPCVPLPDSKVPLVRPRHRWCLIELCTALEHDVPIVCVNLVSGAHWYNFPAAAAFLSSLDTDLNRRSPGAAALLSANGFDLLDATWRLSTTLPAIISIPFNPSSSRSIIGATIADIVDAIRLAQPMEPSLTKAEWHRRRTVFSASLRAIRFIVRLKASVRRPTRLAGQPTQAFGAATIPPEVPVLPAALQERPELLNALKARLLGPTAGTLGVVGEPRRDASPSPSSSQARSAAATTAARGMGYASWASNPGRSIPVSTLLRSMFGSLLEQGSG